MGPVYRTKKGRSIFIPLVNVLQILKLTGERKFSSAMACFSLFCLTVLPICLFGGTPVT